MIIVKTYLQRTECSLVVCVIFAQTIGSSSLEVKAMSRFVLDGLIVRLNEQSAEVLEELCETFGDDDSATIARALRLMKFVCGVTDEDNDLRLLVRYPSGEEKEIVRFGGEMMVVSAGGQLSPLF